MDSTIYEIKRETIRRKNNLEISAINYGDHLPNFHD